MSERQKIIAFGVLFTACRMLIGAFSALFLIHKGLTVEGIAYLKGFQALIILMVDIPLGYIADCYSHKASVLIATLCAAIWLGMTAWAPNTSWLFVAEAFNAISLAFFNGAFDAILASTADKEEAEDKFISTFSHYQKAQFMGMAVAVLISATYGSYTSPFFWVMGSLLLVFQTILLQHWLPQASHAESNGRPLLGYGRLFEDAKTIYCTLQRNGNFLLYFFLASMCLGLIYQTIIQYWQVILAQAFPNWTQTFFYSGAFFLILMVQAWSGKAVQALRSPRTKLNPFIFLIVFSQVLPLLASWTPWLIPIGLILFFYALRSMQIILSGLIMNEIQKNLRATYSSIASTAQRLFLVVLAPFIGLMINKYDLVSIPVFALSMVLLGHGFLRLAGLPALPRTSRPPSG